MTDECRAALLHAAEKLYNLRRDFRHAKEMRSEFGQYLGGCSKYLAWEKIDADEKANWVEIAIAAQNLGASEVVAAGTSETTATGVKLPGSATRKDAEPEAPAGDETCWFVERRDNGQFEGWWTGYPNVIGNGWNTTDPTKAKKCTKAEAESVAFILSGLGIPFRWSDWAATQHQFMGDASARKDEELAVNSQLKETCGATSPASYDMRSISQCPRCGGPADNGHDKCIPPSAYFCIKCTASDGGE